MSLDSERPSREPNLQNIPIRKEWPTGPDLWVDLRRAFMPLDKYVVGVDYAQVELRLLEQVAESTSRKDTDVGSKVD